MILLRRTDLTCSVGHIKRAARYANLGVIRPGVSLDQYNINAPGFGKPRTLALMRLLHSQLSRMAWYPSITGSRPRAPFQFMLDTLSRSQVLG